MGALKAGLEALGCDGVLGLSSVLVVRVPHYTGDLERDRDPNLENYPGGLVFQKLRTRLLPICSISASLGYYRGLHHYLYNFRSSLV